MEILKCDICGEPGILGKGFYITLSYPHEVKLASFKIDLCSKHEPVHAVASKVFVDMCIAETQKFEATK